MKKIHKIKQKEFLPTESLKYDGTAKMKFKVVLFCEMETAESIEFDLLTPEGMLGLAPYVKCGSIIILDRIKRK